MTRTVWLKADDEIGDWDARKRRITAGIEAGVDWVLIDERDIQRVRDLGAVNIAAFAGEDVHVMEAESDGQDPDATVVGKDAEGDGTVDLPPDLSGSADLSALRRNDQPATGGYVHILGPDYETFAEEVARSGEYTIVVGEDWQIIPLENLIARIGDQTQLIAGVQSPEEAQTAYQTLERGVDGVLLDSDDPADIRRTVEIRDQTQREQLDLEWATVTEIEQTGSADRVCVDTGSLLTDSEGMLVGSLARGLFFVHAETADSPYVDSRPFRVNAGAVHAYVREPDGETSYLSELTSGDEIQIVDTDGTTREAIVGRSKIENRPMFRVQAETDEGDHIETLLQNAETIKVQTPEGRRAITEVETGDQLLIYYEDTARHFGEAVEESIIEK